LQQFSLLKKEETAMEASNRGISSNFRHVADEIFGTLLTITTILSGVYVSITFGWFGQAMIEPHPGGSMTPEMLAQAITGITLGLIFILPLVFILMSWAFSKFRNSPAWGTAAWSGLLSGSGFHRHSRPIQLFPHRVRGYSWAFPNRCWSLCIANSTYFRNPDRLQNWNEIRSIQSSGGKRKGTAGYTSRCHGFFYSCRSSFVSGFSSNMIGESEVSFSFLDCFCGYKSPIVLEIEEEKQSKHTSKLVFLFCPSTKPQKTCLVKLAQDVNFEWWGRWDLNPDPSGDVTSELPFFRHLD
jgi:hypothetical protein